MILVDESHSLGTHGPGSAGLCWSWADQVHFITASLAKTFYRQGGYFTASGYAVSRTAIRFSRRIPVRAYFRTKLRPCQPRSRCCANQRWLGATLRNITNTWNPAVT